MLKRIRTMRKNDGGFTLTELLIVIVILGILTGIVVFAVGAFADRGEKAACKSDRKAVEVAVEAYRANTGAYPVDTTATGGTTRMQKLVDEKYLREAPNGGTNYTITLADLGVVTATGC